MTSKIFTPTLGLILEESVDRRTSTNLEQDVLDEYEILTEYDLMVALELDPKTFKKGHYLTGMKFDGQPDDSDSDSNDGDENDSCNVIQNGKPIQNGDVDSNNSVFQSLHRGTMEKNKTIIGKFSSVPDIDKTSNRNSLISETDSIEYQTEDTESMISCGNLSQQRVVRQRKTSGQSYMSMKNGEELLQNYLQHHLGYEFESKQGRKVFVKSVLKKYMSVYYVISPPQVTTIECDGSGIATLLAIKNALKIKDSKIVQDTASINGLGDSPSVITSCLLNDGVSGELNFNDFACAARLNDLSVEAVLVNKESDIKNFRNNVKISCQSEEKICVCYYSCHELYHSTGYYFALIGGYFKEKDLVLLFDASRNKIPPYWIPLSVLWGAIQSKAADETTLTDSKLGYFLIEKGQHEPYVTLNVTKKISIKLSSHVQNYERLIKLREQWERWLLSPTDPQINILQSSIEQIMEIIKTQTMKNVVKDEKAKLTYKQGSLVDSLTKTKTFPIVEKYISSLTSEYFSKLSVFAEWVLETVFITRNKTKQTHKFSSGKNHKKKLVKTNVKMNTFNNTAMLTTWILFWPYEWRNLDSNCAMLSECVKADLESFSPVLLNSFHEQINFVTKIIQSSTRDTYKCKPLH